MVKIFGSAADRQRRWLLLSGVFIALSVVFLLIPVSDSRLKKDADRESAPDDLYISDIVDGDTFILSNGDHIRLLGIDTPEKGEPFYDESVAYAKSLIGLKPVSLEFDKEKTDRYGRQLVYLFIKGRLINNEIISKGVGSVYLFDKNLRFAAELIDSQRSARKTSVGIWSLPVISPEDFYINVRGSFRFHRPLCTALKRVEEADRTIFESRNVPLDLGYSPCRNCRP